MELIRRWVKAGFLIWFALLGISVVDAQPISGAGSPVAEGIRERMVREPVFGGMVFILEAGKKGNPPLVLIHGLGDMASDVWRPLLPTLAESYHVVTFDLPGFGRSQKQNLLYSPGEYARFVKWVVDEFIGAPPILAGHSLGGAIALRYAGDYRNDVSRLVLIDVAGVLERRVYTKEMLGILAEGFTIPFDVDNFLGKMAGGLPNPLFDLDLMLDNEMLRERVLGGDPEKIAAMALIQEDFSSCLFRIKAPTILLWGEYDRVTPLRIGTLLEANLPNARLRIIPGAGHMPMTDQPRRFEAAFFEALSGSIMPTERPAPVGKRSGRCAGSNGMIFEGVYDSLEIVDCQDVRLQNVLAESIVLRRSSVVFDKGELVGKEVGLRAEDSTVTANGLKITASVALAASNSRLDLAGVRLTGRRAAITTGSRVTLLFSVSRINSPHGSGTIHGLRELVEGEEL